MRTAPARSFLSALQWYQRPCPLPGSASPGRRIPSGWPSSPPSLAPKRRTRPAIRSSLRAISTSRSYDEGLTHFNDNRRLHIFVADISSGQIRQLTDGTHYEHSIDWSPDGREIAFVSNREPNEDQFFNYDLFTLNVATGAMRRITATENAEYQPRWSPDGKTIVYLGTKRGLTDLETTMEDTHVWLIDADGRNRRELGGRSTTASMKPVVARRQMGLFPRP